jgi:hypothetical protein
MQLWRDGVVINLRKTTAWGYRDERKRSRGVPGSALRSGQRCALPGAALVQDDSRVCRTTIDTNRRVLTEPHTDPLFLAPDYGAGQMRSIGLNDEREAFGDADGARDIECGTGIGEVANRAVDRAAAELDRSGLEHTMPRSVPPFVHARIYTQS